MKRLSIVLGLLMLSGIAIADVAEKTVKLPGGLGKGVLFMDEDLDRIRTALPESTRLLREQPDDIDTALVALSSFSVELSELLEVEEDRIQRFLVSGRRLGAMLEDNRSEIDSLVDGVADYMRVLGGAAGLLEDDTVFAYFRLFITEESQDPILLLQDEMERAP